VTDHIAGECPADDWQVTKTCRGRTLNGPDAIDVYLDGLRRIDG
jgi:hypothetical protein